MDVGGGDGTLLLELVGRFPELHATLFDQPSVVAGCPRDAFDGRLRVVGGDFFEAVPRGGDAYILKFILHDWDDPEALTILRNCARAMQPGSRLILVERLLATPNDGAEGKLSDLNMLVNLGGRERTEAEYRALLAEVGLTLVATNVVDHQVCALEADLGDAARKYALCAPDVNTTGLARLAVKRGLHRGQRSGSDACACAACHWLSVADPRAAVAQQRAG